MSERSVTRALRILTDAGCLTDCTDLREEVPACLEITVEGWRRWKNFDAAEVARRVGQPVPHRVDREGQPFNDDEYNFRLDEIWG